MSDYRITVGETVTLRVAAGSVDATFEGCPFPTFADAGVYTFNRLTEAPPYRLFIPGDDIKLIAGPPAVSGLFLSMAGATFGDMLPFTFGAIRDL